MGFEAMETPVSDAVTNEFVMKMADGLEEAKSALIRERISMHNTTIIDEFQHQL